MAVGGVGGAASGPYRVQLPGLSGKAEAVQRAAKAAAANGGLGGASGPDGVGRTPEQVGPGAANAPDGFGQALVNALDAVEADVKGGDRLATKAVRGESVEVHEMMMALEKADLSVRLMTQVGRRAVEAYREIMRMNV